jgi:hypothetical protein
MHRKLDVRAPAIAAAGAVLGCWVSAATNAAAFQEEGDERVDYTAYTLHGGEFSLGPFKAQFGVADFFTVGTYVPPWFLFPLLDATVPTGFVKVRDPFFGPVAVSARAGFVYVDASALASDYIENTGVDASLWVVPVELATSVRFSKQYSQSVEAVYVAAFAHGDETADATIKGAGALSNLTLSTLLELRLTRVFALTLLARALVYQGRAHVTAHFKEGTTGVDADLGTRDFDAGFIACAVPGVAFSWANINLELGLGYGNWWLPVVQLPLPDRGLVPEGNFYVRF